MYINRFYLFINVTGFTECYMYIFCYYNNNISRLDVIMCAWNFNIMLSNGKCYNSFETNFIRKKCFRVLKIVEYMYVCR